MNLLDRIPPKADRRPTYGSLPLQFGDLWVPDTPGQPLRGWPLLVFIHGGWWKAAYDLGYASFLCQAMKAQGVAVWSLEYRRVGDFGGGWPGTMQDVAAGMDHVVTLAEQFPLDRSRVAAVGHSAGGQLAFWLAGRHHIPHTSVLAAESQTKIKLKSVVSLAGAVDLRLTIQLGGIVAFTNGGPAVEALMGGSPLQVPDRYRAADPGELLPFGIPQTLIQGKKDDQIPPQLPHQWAQLALRQGDRVRIELVAGADHFDVVDPESSAWPITRDVLLKSVSP